MSGEEVKRDKIVVYNNKRVLPKVSKRHVYVYTYLDKCINK